MDKFVAETQNYFTNVVNKNKETVNQYNNALRQQWMLERSYTQGKFSVGDTRPEVILFGKPSNIEKRINQIFDSFENNIIEDEDLFIKFLNDRQEGFSKKLVRVVKDNYVNFVKNKRASFQGPISTITQGLTAIEQSYIQTLGKVNFIIYSGVTDKGTDGYQAKTGKPTIYVTTGTGNAHQELIDDVKKIQTNIAEYNAAIWGKTKFTYNQTTYEGELVFKTATNGITESKVVTVENVFTPFSNDTKFKDNLSFRRQYMIMSEDVLDEKKYESFKQALIGNVVNNQSLVGNGATNLDAVFDAYWILTAKPLFLEENNITKAFITELEKTKLKDFLKYTPFAKKERIFNYTIQNGASEDKKNAQQDMVKGLGASTNLNTNNNTWNDENGATGAFTSKAKLN